MAEEAAAMDAADKHPVHVHVYDASQVELKSKLYVMHGTSRP